MWKITTLQIHNLVESVFQWASGHPSTIQEMCLDGDNDEFCDTNYDVLEMVNNLTKAFHNGMC